MSRIRLGGTVVTAVIALDQVTKSIVLRTISADDRIRVFGPVSLVLRFNKGGAFSIGHGRGLFPWVVFALVIGLTSWYVFSLLLNTKRGLFSVGAFGCMVGGALGNQMDRLFRGPGWNRGAVVDFVATGFWPVFNVADAALTCGAIAVALSSLGGQQTSKADSRAQIEEEGTK